MKGGGGPQIVFKKIPEYMLKDALKIVKGYA